MRANINDFLYEGSLSEEGLSLEKLSGQLKDSKKIYILLTDTKTRFSKIARMITGDPYNHVSMMLEYDFDNVFTFSLTNGFKGGGFLREDRADLDGSRYSLYEMNVDEDVHKKVSDRIEYLRNHVSETAYNHFGLINAILKKNLIKDDQGAVAICSQFVANVLEEAGIAIFNDKPHSTLRPYDFVKSKLLKFVERGTIKAA